MKPVHTIIQTPLGGEDPRDWC